MSRFDLTEFEWPVIAPLLPNKPRGVARVDDRRVLKGNFRIMRSDSPWLDLPEMPWPSHHLLQPVPALGVGGRIQIAFTGLVIATAVVTGLLVWCRKRQQRQRAAAMGRRRSRDQPRPA